MRDKLSIFLVYTLIFIISFTSFSYAASSDGDGYLTEEGLINSLPLPLDDSFYPFSKSFDDVFADIDQNGSGTNYYISNELEYFVFYNNSKLYVFFYHPDYITFSYLINNSYIVFNCAFSNWYYKNVDSVFYVTNALVTITENNGEFNYTYSRSNANLNFDLRLYYEANASTIPTHPEGYHLQGLPCFKTEYNPVINISGDFYNLFEDVPDNIVDGDISVPELPDDDINKGLFSGLVNYLNQFLKKIFSGISGVILSINTIGESILSKIQSIWDILSQFFSDLFSFFDSVKNVFDSIFELGNLNGKFDIDLFLTNLFRDDDEYFISRLNDFMVNHFYFIDEIRQIIIMIRDFLVECVSSESAPVIIISGHSHHFGPADSVLGPPVGEITPPPGSNLNSPLVKSSLTKDIVWDFSWYLPYKPTVDNIISAFIIVFFSWRLATGMPNVINGVASPFVAVSNDIGVERGHKNGVVGSHKNGVAGSHKVRRRP